MKSPMQKMDLLIRQDERQRMTDHLQSIGLLHLEELGLETSINNDPEWKEWLEVKIWLNKQEDQASIETQSIESPLLPKLKNLQDQWAHWQHSKDEYERSLKFWQHWKGYDPEQWKDLEKKGLHIGLYRGDRKEYQQVKDEAFLIAEDDDLTYFCMINSKEVLENSNLDEESLPPIIPDELKGRKEEIDEEESRLLSLIHSFKAQESELENEANQIAEKWEFQEGSKLWKNINESPLVHLRAWLAKSNLEQFKRDCKELPIAYRIMEPEKKIMYR